MLSKEWASHEHVSRQVIVVRRDHGEKGRNAGSGEARGASVGLQQ